MVKEPRLGAVKTRLALQIGPAGAMRFCRSACAAILARLSRDPRWRTVLCVAPDTALRSPAWPASIPRVVQGGGDLGRRMQRVFAVMPPGPVVIVGTDIPQITPARIAAAFRALGGADAAVGPAEDGGYWLIGLRRSPRLLRPFARVRWSGPHALADTLANLSRARVARLGLLADVDDEKSHRRLAGAGGRVVLPPWWRPEG